MVGDCFLRLAAFQKRFNLCVQFIHGQCGCFYKVSKFKTSVRVQ